MSRTLTPGPASSSSWAGVPGPDGVEVANREEPALRMVQLADQGHVAEHVRVPREVDLEAVLELDDEAHRLTAVAAVGQRRAVLGVDHGEGDPVDHLGTARVHAS